jgi:hypothetical protein
VCLFHTEIPKLVFIKRTETHLLACFNIAVSVPSEKDIKVDLPNDKTWTSPLETNRSKLWMIHLPEILKGSNHDLSLTGDYIKQFFNQDTISFKGNMMYGEFEPYFDQETKVCNRKSTFFYILL